MSIKALVFDFGNVVGYFSHRRTTERLAPHAGIAADDLHQMLYWGTLAESYERGDLSTDAFRTAVKRAAGLQCSDDFFDQAYADIFWPNRELCDLLPALARRYPLLLLSNTNDLHARQFRVQFAEPLGLFRHLLLSHEVRGRKPEREVFEHTTRLAGCAPGEIVFFDDVERNVAGARACGWQGVVFTGTESVAACGLVEEDSHERFPPGRR
jgi:putative hydrolase of the HAD superfamily